MTATCDSFRRRPCLLYRLRAWRFLVLRPAAVLQRAARRIKKPGTMALPALIYGTFYFVGGSRGRRTGLATVVLSMGLWLHGPQARPPSKARQQVLASIETGGVAPFGQVLNGFVGSSLDFLDYPIGNNRMPDSAATSPGGGTVGCDVTAKAMPDAARRQPVVCQSCWIGPSNPARACHRDAGRLPPHRPTPQPLPKGARSRLKKPK